MKGQNLGHGGGGSGRVSGPSGLSLSSGSGPLSADLNPILRDQTLRYLRSTPTMKHSAYSIFADTHGFQTTFPYSDNVLIQDE